MVILVSLYTGKCGLTDFRERKCMELYFFWQNVTMQPLLAAQNTSFITLEHQPEKQMEEVTKSI